MVKIENHHPLRSLSSVKAKKTGSTGTSFSKEVSANYASSSSEVSNVLTPQGVFCIQEVSDFSHSKRQQAFEKGEKLLENLDHLRMALLEGVVSHQTLNELKEMLKNCEIEDISDPIHEVLEEIELRVQVELAKLDAAKDDMSNKS